MILSVRPLTEVMAAEVSGVNLSGDLSQDKVNAIREAWLRYTVLVFPGQRLTPERQAAFTRRLGELEHHTVREYIHPDVPELFVISNIVKEGRNVGAPKSGRHWHSDSQFLAVPSAGSLLYGVQVPPEGGDTLFANMYAAYDALSDAMKRRIDGLRTVCSRVKAWPVSYPGRRPLTDEQKASLPDVVHPLVRTHPETGRKSLYIGGNVVWEIVGVPYEEGRALLDTLRAHATEDRFTYRHRWRKGDAVLWDNRCTLHTATPFDEERYDRLMHRTTMRGSIPVWKPA